MGTLLIETKENSPEKLAAIAGKDTKYFLMAGELNDIVEAINESGEKITVLQGLQNLKTNFTGPAFAIWTGVGLIYDVIYPDFYLEGVLYPGATQQVTLPPAHSVYDRKDIIAVNASGAFSVQGEPEEVALAPTFDTNTVIYISTADVPANSTVPGNVSEKVVFKENSEFTTFSNSGAINFNSNLSPFQGAIHIDCTSVSAGNTMKFTDSVLNSITDYSLFRFFVSLKSVFSNSTRFYVRFLKDGIAVSSTVEIISGNYNFNRNTVNIYQGVIIPITAFSFTNSQFNGVEIFMYGSNASGFRMDNIILSKGETSTSPTQKTITSIVTDSGVVNATVADDTIEMKSANTGLVISAVGKIITFTSLFTSALKTGYDAAYTWFSTNGASVMVHLSRTDNPHNVTAAQVGAPSGSGNSTGTNTGDQVLNIQKNITGNLTLDNTYDRAIIKVKANATITVPSTLAADFSAVFDCWTGATATFVAGAGATIVETALILPPTKMATLYKDGSTTTYKLKGETTT
ncbi:hypothetical protein [Flavobacterium maritimum]|uniref:hypothetical protein n=1 Tax=Flavobacterium maritimum TaxID=3149042 RepID=UPI0032B5C2EC